MRGLTSDTWVRAACEASLEPLRFDVRDMVAESDKVAVIGEAEWRVKSTGRSYTNPWVDVFTLRDGKIVRTDAHYDSLPAKRVFRPDRPDAATALRHRTPVPSVASCAMDERGRG